MRRTQLRVASLLAALAVSALPAVSEAQSCLGNPSFSVNHLQLGANAQFETGATTFDANFVSGSESVFGGLGVGGVTYDDLEGSTLVVGGLLGYQVPVSSRGAQICPLLSVSQGFGPNDFDGLGSDFSVRTFRFGISMGTTLARAGRVALAPAASIGFAFAQRDFSGPLAPGNQTDTYGLAGVALGVLVSDALSIRPSVTLPFGLDENDPIFGIGFALNYGGRR